MKSHRTSLILSKESCRLWVLRVLPTVLILSVLVSFSGLSGYLQPRYSPRMHSMGPDGHAKPAEDFYVKASAPQGTTIARRNPSTREVTPGEKPWPFEHADLITGAMIIRRLGSHLRNPDGSVSAEYEAAKDLLGHMRQQRSVIDRTPTLCPAGGLFTSPFGWRGSPFTGKREFHKGVDIASLDASPVYAAADGVVASYGPCGTFGNVMEIDHGFGLVTRYGHLRQPAVRSGRRVKKGDKIAYIGDSGRTTGTHLHYEILVHGVNVNPQRYMLK